MRSLAILLLLAQPVRAESDAPPDEEVQARLHFLRDKLQAGVTTNMLWYAGWSSFYGAAMVAQLARVGFTDNTAERADLIVSASKATIGVVARLLRPPSAIHGSRELTGMPERTAEERWRKVVRAEALLARNAKESDQRYSWIAHTVNLALNIGGGLIVWLGYDDFVRGASSAGIGIIVGEVQIWSQPWRAKRDWQEYQRRFGARAAVPSSVRLTFTPAVIPSGAGAMIGFHF
jgi:hypothetical protein